MAEQKQDDQLEHTYCSSARIRDVPLKTCQRRWTIGRSGKRGSGISVLAERQDDDDDVGVEKGEPKIAEMHTHNSDGAVFCETSRLFGFVLPPRSWHRTDLKHLINFVSSSSFIYETITGPLLLQKRSLGTYIRGSLNKFPDFFRLGTFIENTHMKL